jgi:hypothetical protein
MGCDGLSLQPSVMKGRAHRAARPRAEGRRATQRVPGGALALVTYGDENVAVGFLGAFILNEQVPVPEQMTPHPLNVEPGFAVALTATVAPLATIAEHDVAEQLNPMTLAVPPAGVAVPAITPVPVPPRVTVSG